jgi:hypothetical protein
MKEEKINLNRMCEKIGRAIADEFKPTPEQEKEFCDAFERELIKILKREKK